VKILAIGYSTKDQVELTRQTWPRLVASLPKNDPLVDVFWADASKTAEAVEYWDQESLNVEVAECVGGGADAAIAWKLSKMLASDATHVMLLENDCLLDEDWLTPTMQLFEKGAKDGLEVGAVSPRSYVDRVLIQRDGFAVMHNLGAGVCIFTREAAEIVLHTFRTGWWPNNVALFAQLSGIDLRTYAAFRGNDQWVTSDWTWEAQLARHGLASLALTPAKCQMIGQNPPLAQQGLELTTKAWCTKLHDVKAWSMYRASMDNFRDRIDSFELPGTFHRDGAGMLFFPHQTGALGGLWQGSLELVWNQGYGPFSYRAGPGGASLSAHISGSAWFQCSGGDAGARLTIEDHRSGFKAQPNLAPNTAAAITVPGTVVPRLITMRMEEGAIFQSLSCVEPQLIDTTWKFSWDQLPKVRE
jgi:hypothetical protein